MIYRASFVDYRDRRLTLPPLVEAVISKFAALPSVEAVALGGSHATGFAGENSDFDVYVYAHEAIPLETRAAIAHEFTDQPEIDNSFWGPGDEWIASQGKIGMDLIYFPPSWMEDQLDRVLRRYQPSVGYSTCFWHTVRVSIPLYDRGDWFKRMQEKAALPYPEPLRRAIVANNHPILRKTISAYYRQIEKAAMRGDLVSVNHRVAALIASYFDILFAVNRRPHPGEKRLVEWTTRLCPQRPEHMERDLENLLRAAAAPDRSILDCIDALVDGLDQLLLAEGLIGDSGRVVKDEVTS